MNYPKIGEVWKVSGGGTPVTIYELDPLNNLVFYRWGASGQYKSCVDLRRLLDHCERVSP